MQSRGMILNHMIAGDEALCVTAIFTLCCPQFERFYCIGENKWCTFSCAMVSPGRFHCFGWGKGLSEVNLLFRKNLNEPKVMTYQWRRWFRLRGRIKRFLEVLFSTCSQLLEGNGVSLLKIQKNWTPEKHIIHHCVYNLLLDHVLFAVVRQPCGTEKKPIWI